MKALLFLVAVAAAAGAVYECYLQQQAQAAYVQARATDLQQIAQLTAQNTQLELDNGQATGNLGH